MEKESGNRTDMPINNTKKDGIDYLTYPDKSQLSKHVPLNSRENDRKMVLLQFP